jgi:hypothetical protein
MEQCCVGKEGMMTRRNYEENATVDKVVRDLPGAGGVLYANGINRTTRYSLANMAAATSTSMDELMARLDVQARRIARQATPAPQAQPVEIRPVEVKPAIVEHVNVEFVEEEAELVA